MRKEKLVSALAQLGSYLNDFVVSESTGRYGKFTDLLDVLALAEAQNPWFTRDNLLFCLKSWSENLTEELLKTWLSKYKFSNSPKKVGLILAGNIPMVGLHDVLCVILSGNFALIKLSSKDMLLIPFMLKKWSEFFGESLSYQFVEKLQDFDAVIATGTNNTARYLEYYFKDKLSVIRKNRTSIAVLTGSETDSELQLLGKDIFTYFGLGCRNVSRIFIPEDFALDRLFENFVPFENVINHHKYANNYNYNKAIYLLNGDLFWDNNFVMLREEESFFSPLSVINFSRYHDLQEVLASISSSDIQCLVGLPERVENAVYFGQAQNPRLDDYADGVDTMAFLNAI